LRVFPGQCNLEKIRIYIYIYIYIYIFFFLSKRLNWSGEYYLALCMGLRLNVTKKNMISMEVALMMITRETEFLADTI
jgi:hypothetical protein